MALIRYGPIAQEVSGTIGGVTFARVQCGKDARGWRAPVNRKTPNQMFIRYTCSRASKRWFAILTSGDRQAWADYAPSCTFTNSLGQSYTIKGNNFYSRNYLLIVGHQYGTEAAPPTEPGFGDPYTPVFTLNHSTGVFAFTGITPTPESGLYLLYHISRIQPVTRIYPRPHLFARANTSCGGDFPKTLTTFPNPLPGTAGDFSALIRYYLLDEDTWRIGAMNHQTITST